MPGHNLARPGSLGANEVENKTVRCKRCDSIMFKAHSEKNAQSIQEWYDCPMCRRQAVISEPLSADARAWLGSTGNRRGQPFVRFTPDLH